MAKLILPKSTTATRTGATPVAGEILYDTEEKKFYGGDGVTPGGVPFTFFRPYDNRVYGLDYDTTIATAASACQKVVLNNIFSPAGDPASYTQVVDFTARPAHNWKRCVVNTATRAVQYYLHPSDSTKKTNGTAADLTGTDGEVMVEIPVTYYRIDRYTDTNSHPHIVWLVSDQSFPNAEPHPFFYVSPGGATLRTQYVCAFMPTLTGAETISDGALRSIVSDSVPFVGGSFLAARTGYSRSNMQIANVAFQWFMQMMMAIDFGTFDIQSALSPGLVNTTLTSSDIPSFMRKPGRTLLLGNSSGGIAADSTLDADLDEYWGSTTSENKIVACSYRGVENPYGALYAEYGGIIDSKHVTSSTPQHGPGIFWTCDSDQYHIVVSSTTNYWEDTSMPSYNPKGKIEGATGDAWLSIAHDWQTDGVYASTNSSLYTSAFDPLTFLPVDSETRGSTSTYLCDISEVKGQDNSAVTTISYGGLANSGSAAGPFCIYDVESSGTSYHHWHRGAC